MKWVLLLMFYLSMGMGVAGFTATTSDGFREAMKEPGGPPLLGFTVIFWPFILGAQVGKISGVGQ